VNILRKFIFEHIPWQLVISEQALLKITKNGDKIFRNGVRRGFLSLGSNIKITLGPREEKFGPP
jgi:hypothetical protein